MKKLNKKGFTIVELVIVIAVIGILSAVLIPTFSNLTEKANESAALQAATNEYKEWQIKYADSDKTLNNSLFEVEQNNQFYYFLVNNTKLEYKGVKSATLITSGGLTEIADYASLGNPKVKICNGTYLNA